MKIFVKILLFIAIIVSGGLALLGMKFGILGLAFLTVPFGLTCGLLLGKEVIGPYVGNSLANQVYTPKNIKPMPPEFPQIRAKIANEKYGEAVADLKALLEKDPGNYHIIELLIEIFVNKTNDHENAIGLISAYLKKDGRCAQDVPIVMKLVDVYLEEDALDEAIGLLEDEMERKYPDKELKYIKARLEGIDRKD
ncbi:MAG TPA: hypothetical protein DET40_12310 [Lentisphaeria bacterium]|nr:MAG: hypothetical protein A2X45_00295 [Lentisphaerae bacterium GWF2_50_93]HCE44322.1 hypothetical protein [Lentisphaeria bacterium]